MTDATLRIGTLAEQAEVSVSAIRFYERQGLLPEPERVHGQRRYTAGDLSRLRMIGAAKRAGLSLAEIRALLASTEAGAPAHEQLRVLAARKLPEVETAIERAEETRSWLHAAAQCECETLDSCALFVA